MAKSKTFAVIVTILMLLVWGVLLVPCLGCDECQSRSTRRARRSQSQEVKDVELISRTVTDWCTRVYKVRIDDHKYFVFRSDDGGIFAQHDPTCPCKISAR